MRILLVEDDPVLSDQIKTSLSDEGRAVDAVADGEEALYMGQVEPYDLVVMDIGLPSRDGISIIKQWRKEAVQTPVLLLTARDGWHERVDGLDAGADDYMTKPFFMPELSARIRAMLRRQSGNASPLFEKGSVSFDTRTNTVIKDGMPVSLTAQELAVLSYLFHNAGRMISRTEMSEHIYEYDGDRDSNTIAVFVNRLRKKLGNDLITSARGQGYKIDL
ncbi:MAG: response regulator transcription factor [Rhodobacteraceae bacterium]|nr:response regulator transcription factor [Paracoccaceae bacterium]